MIFTPYKHLEGIHFLGMQVKISITSKIKSNSIYGRFTEIEL